jgi:diphosphomevalonate decarboxylase
MTTKTFTAIAHPNIAFIKYWGNLDPVLRIPSNGSISMTLGDLTTRTSVRFDDSLSEEIIEINGEIATGSAHDRAAAHLDRIRTIAGISTKAEVRTISDFPLAAGLASSASGFAALSLAGTKAAGLSLSSPELSSLARKASGSASRSIIGGFVEWIQGNNDESSHAVEIADMNHWDLIDVIAIVREEEKAIGSTEGHSVASSSALQDARIGDAKRRLDICRRAIVNRDFESLSQVVEEDSNMMHSVMITSNPPIFYWEPATINIIKSVERWRKEGLHVCYTIDAGPNVHCICTSESAPEIQARLSNLQGVNRVLSSKPGGACRIT